MRKRVLVVQPGLGPLGGGGGVCAWILEALRHDHEVTLLCWRRPDLDAVNRYYGTALTADSVRLEEALPALPARVRPPPVLRRLAHFALLAEARRRRPAVDLVISAEEESDLGGGGLQYVHFPWHHPARGAARLYHGVAARLTGTSAARMRTNVTVVNSDWTGARVRALHGIDTITVHPPAAGRFPDGPWGERADGFVACGRATRAKRFERIIAILDGVRARGHDVGLHLVLAPDTPAYERDVRALAQREDLDVLLLVSVRRFGTIRPYYGFIPLGAPKGFFEVVGQMVDLKTNQLLWQTVIKEADAQVAVAEPWDQPPEFPNVDAAILQAIENGKAFLLKEFFAAPAA